MSGVRNAAGDLLIVTYHDPIGQMIARGLRAAGRVPEGDPRTRADWWVPDSFLAYIASDLEARCVSIVFGEDAEDEEKRQRNLARQYLRRIRRALGDENAPACVLDNT